MNARGPYSSASTPLQPGTLGQRLRWLRNHRALTQVELAQALGCEQALISMWESDKAQPSGVSLTALAQFHGLPSGVLESGEGFLVHAAEALERLRQKARGEAPEPVHPTVEPAPRGLTAVVDLQTQQTHHVNSADAMTRYLQATKKGREVWIVVR